MSLLVPQSSSLPSPQSENLKIAQQYFQLMGTSGSECGKYTSHHHLPPLYLLLFSLLLPFPLLLPRHHSLLFTSSSLFFSSLDITIPPSLLVLSSTLLVIYSPSFYSLPTSYSPPSTSSPLFTSSSPDTIPGRQAMASCFFLLRQFDDVLVYLSSIKVTFAPNPYYIYTEEAEKLYW